MSDPRNDPSAELGDETLVAAPADPRSTTGDGGEARRLEPGTVLADRFRIVTRLGQGGMGEVYRADDLQLEVSVALKFLPPELRSDRARHAQLFDEVKVARQISHPNVCRVFDVGEADGTYFLSMEYIDGEDLRSLLRRIGRPAWDKSIELGLQMCAGLAAAHEVGVLHRDLKPANLMIDGQGRARITDFGLAALAKSLRREDPIAGTPLYMSPEQFQGRPASVASDLYALGLVLYELFTGRRAFDAATSSDAAKLHQLAIPTPPSELRFGFDRAVEDIILRCLEKKPGDRPGSVEEVAATLEGSTGVELADGVQVATLLCSELATGAERIEGSVDTSRGELFLEHDRLTRDLAERHGGREIDRSERHVILFRRPIEALRYALAYHRGLDELASERRIHLAARVALHLGEVVVRKNPPREIERGARPLELEGFARPMADRLLSLAEGRQTLLTQAAFDVVRRGARGELEDGDSLRWLAHGEYVFPEADEPTAVFEVGVADFAPLRPPNGTAEAPRVGAEETILGWRPAPGLKLPQRPHWTVQRKLGEGGFGEAWLVTHDKTEEGRVFKFCYGQEQLASLQREIAVFRLLKEELGQRDDIARVRDWNLEEAPYFLELDHAEGGNLRDWAMTRGGIDQVPLGERLELVAQTATALAAAHSVGVLHKDVKPDNVLVHDRGDTARAVLTDFGIGAISDERLLAARGITFMGSPDKSATTPLTSTGGTQLYMAPEVLAGQPATIQADIYALGVLLYQMAVADLDRPMPHGWRRQVEDELLREDIADLVDGNPERRPGSAAEVADRIRRLEERRAERDAERQRREDAERARRRRRVLALTATLSTVFLVVVSVLALQALRARADAERRQAQAERLVDFMLNDLYQGLDRIGRLDLLEGVARSSQRHFESLSERDESAEAVYQRGMTLVNIGEVLLAQGDADAARESNAAALALFEAAAEREPGDATWGRATSLARLGLGNVLREQGDSDAARAAYRVALEEARRLASERPDDRELQLAVARAHFEIATLESRIGDSRAALDEATRALPLLDELTASDEAEWREHLLRLDTLAVMERVHRFNGDFEKALQTVGQAQRIAERMLVEDPGNGFWPRRLAWSQSESGVLLYFSGDLDGSLRSLGEARDTYRSLTVSDPTRAEWRERRAFNLQFIGLVHGDRGEPRRALELYTEAREIQAALVEEDPTRVIWLRALALNHQTTSSLHLSQDRLVAAAESMETAVSLLDRMVAVTGDDPAPINLRGWMRVMLGDVYERASEPDRARRQWTLAADSLAPITASSDEVQFLDTHAQALLRLGRLEESRPLVEKLLEQGWDDPEFLQLVRRRGLPVELP